MTSSPDSPPSVADRLRARRARIARIRKRALAAAAGTFVLAWGVLFVQLVSGHDPALAKHGTAGATAASTSAAPRTSASGSTSSASSSSTSSAPGSSGSASPITTSQS